MNQEEMFEYFLKKYLNGDDYFIENGMSERFIGRVNLYNFIIKSIFEIKEKQGELK